MAHPTKAVPVPALELLALSAVRGAGRKTLFEAVDLARRSAQRLDALFGQDPTTLARLPGASGPNTVNCLARCGSAELHQAGAMLEFARKQGVQWLTFQEPGFPGFLRESLRDQAPPVLFYVGNEALLHVPGAAIVGTRRPSPEGVDWARKAAALFAHEGVTIFSGGARGIDMEAHGAALRADGNTCVVLPTGLYAWDTPPSLQMALESGRALVVSEWFPNTPWSTHQAMSRNRTIAGCARLTCVIEPAETGGSRYTAETTLTQDKPVFYWGGACREGFLKDTPNARPLGGRYGELNRDALLDAMLNPPAPGPAQGELF